MGTTKAVRTAESNDFLVIESHAVENVTNVLGSLGGVGETTVRSAGGSVSVYTAGSPWDIRATELLNSADTTKGVEVAVRDPWEFGCKENGQLFLHNSLAEEMYHV